MSFLKPLPALFIVGGIVLLVINNTKLGTLLILVGTLVTLLDYYRKGTLFK